MRATVSGHRRGQSLWKQKLHCFAGGQRRTRGAASAATKSGGTGSLYRYVDEAKRLLGVLDQRLKGRAWMMGDDYTIVDISTFPWVRNLIGFYEAADLVGIGQYREVVRALDAFLARPAVKRGLHIPSDH